MNNVLYFSVLLSALSLLPADVCAPADAQEYIMLKMKPMSDFTQGKSVDNLSDKELMQLLQELKKFRDSVTLELSTRQQKEEFTRLVKHNQLDLTGECFMQLYPTVFEDFPGLQVLNFSANQLDNLPVNIFKGLIKLRQLYLNCNYLSSLPEYVFREPKL